MIVLGVGMTFLCSHLLSGTLLRGVPSGFTLELPPYRMPQFGRVIVRSVFDRTLFVLGRAVSVAAPAGLVIWLLANVTVNDVSLLAHISGALDPFARVFGLDGVILLAFILGFPANEIVIPIAAMAYLSTGTIAELGNTELHALLLQNGWTPVTALCTVLFSAVSLALFDDLPDHSPRDRQPAVDAGRYCTAHSHRLFSVLSGRFCRASAGYFIGKRRLPEALFSLFWARTALLPPA